MQFHESEEGAMRRRLAELKTEHRDLDQALEALMLGTYVDQLQVRRMKKRKLMLKDRIAYIEDALIPDQPA